MLCLVTAVCSRPAGKPMTLNILSSWSWWNGLLVLMSSWRQWKMGSDVSSSAKMQPIAQISDAHTHTRRRHLVWVFLYISYSALVFPELMKVRFFPVCWKIDFTFVQHRLFMVNIKTFVMLSSSRQLVWMRKAGNKGRERGTTCSTRPHSQLNCVSEAQCRLLSVNHWVLFLLPGMIKIDTAASFWWRSWITWALRPSQPTHSLNNTNLQYTTIMDHSPERVRLYIPSPQKLGGCVKSTQNRMRWFTNLMKPYFIDSRKSTFDTNTWHV